MQTDRAAFPGLGRILCKICKGGKLGRLVKGRIPPSDILNGVGGPPKSLAPAATSLTPRPGVGHNAVLMEEARDTEAGQSRRRGADSESPSGSAPQLVA